MKTLNKEIALLIAVSIALTVSIFGFAGAALAQPINVTVTTAVISGQNQATFTATENGAAKGNVSIYLDGILSGQTDSNGRYVASGLAPGSHAWEAKYGGGSVGIGRFVFFGYGILATGTDSPPRDFTYAINVTASRSGLWGYDAGTSGEYKQCFIDTPDIASGCYLKCKRREIRASIHYGITFDSNPSINISSTGYDGANPHVGGSRWCSVLEEGSDGCILRSFVFYVGYTILGSRVDKWLPADNAQFSITWSGSKAGSNSVSKNDVYKLIETISNAPTSGTSLALTVNGVTYHGEYSVEGGGVKLWFVGNELRAAYIASPQPWSQICSGTGSVTDKDVDKLVTVCSSEAPNRDTIYTLNITVDGVQVRDQDSNDIHRAVGTIEYKGVIAWMQGKELHASMSYHPPTAFIDSISPKFAQIGESIIFSGHGEDQDAGDFITGYKWRSHKDGNLSTLGSFTRLLSGGRHVIYFQVADSTPYTQPYTPLWSPEATDGVRVNKPPSAYISSIRGSGIDADGYPTLVLGDSMTFQGVGIDTDGHITAYEWRSNISGLLSTSESFSISNLPIDHHTITLKVKDNDGTWSKEVSQVITVRRTPVVYVGGWQPRGDYVDISRHYERLDPEGTPDSCNLRIEHSNRGIIYYAHVLSDEIEELKRNTGARKVDIVAHSMGGLISRWYIQQGYRNDVRRFVSVGSPHHGSDWADFPELGAIPTPSLLSWLGGEAGIQMIPHSPFLNIVNGHDGCAWTRNRGTDHINPDVQYSVIAATGYLTPEHHHLEIELFGVRIIDITMPWLGLGDFIVATYSAKLDGAKHIEVNSDGPFWAAHTDLAFPDKREDVWTYVKEILRDDSRTSNAKVQGSVKNFQHPSDKTGDTQDLQESINSLTVIHRAEPILDTIHPGGIKSHTTRVDPTAKKAFFELLGVYELDLVLFSPSGARIDPSDPSISYTRKVGCILYEISNPEHGNWTLEVTSPITAESGCNYAIRTLMETDLFVGVGTDKNEYKPNDPIMIYAYVQDHGAPFKGAIVTAEIQKSDASSETIFLFDDGAHDDGKANDGIYANTYHDSSKSGLYNITVTAAIPKDGESYSRSASKAVWVELFPDLAISASDIAFSNANPKHGDNVTITATIYNIGDADVKNVKILFFDGDPANSGVSIGEGTIDLPAGGATNVSVPWKAVRGTHTIHVIIDPFSDCLEQSYDNNRAKASLTAKDTEVPIADAGPDQVVLVDTPVFFDGSGSTDNAGIVNYTWDIDASVDSDGDGIPDNDIDLTGVKPIYAGGYHSTGTYVVKVSVNDADGNGPVSDILIVDVTSEYDREKPVAVAGSDQTVRLRVPVFFDASRSNDNFEIASYQWDVDISVDSDQDGIPDNDIDLIGVRPMLVSGYSKSGQHTVKLTVDDVAGNGPSTDMLTLTIINSPPVADAGGSYFAGEGSLVMLDGSGSEDPDGDRLKYRWDFDGDGTWDTEWSTVSTAPYTWRDDYSGVIRLEVSDGDQSDIGMAEVRISNVAPKVEAGPDRKVEAGDIVSFCGFITDPGALDTHAINWDFGDGNTAAGDLTVTHKYDVIGVYHVELTVTDDDGGTEKDTLLVSVVSKTSPGVSTDAVTDVTTNSAVLKGTLVYLGTASPVRVVFKWGLDTSYGHETDSQAMTHEGSFSLYLTGLRSSTTYHFRAKAVGDGTSYGEDMSFATATPPPATTVWVDDDYTQSSSGGHTWGYDAFNNIQDGIDAVASPGTVHVAAGTYNENVTMKSCVEILGAGAGVSIIDGGGDGSVVTASGVGTTAKLDGFTIANGTADNGGGIYMVGSSPTISNCIISGNSANYGGGIRCNSSSPNIINCIVSQNLAIDGGGIGCWSDSSPTITNCTIDDNAATEGWGGGIILSNSSPNVTDCIIRDNIAIQSGGIECTDGSSPTISACTIKGNQASNLGGGIRCYRGALPIINNCIITANQAPIGGGIVCQDYAEPTFINCTITGNQADNYGGGILCHGYPSWPTITNCIIWENIPDQVGCGTAGITYCDIDQDGFAGSNGNIRRDPLLVGGEDYHLRRGSPCVDAGTNSSPELPDNDFEGDPRIIDGNNDGTAMVDMGADELNTCEGDFDSDRDVDGSDLAIFAAGRTGITLEEFAAEFGRTDCPR